MNKIYKILLGAIGLKAISGIFYFNSLIEHIELRLEFLKSGIEVDDILRFIDTFLTLTVCMLLIIGLVLQLLQKKMCLNKWLKLSISYYVVYFLIVSVPSLIFMDSIDFVSRMEPWERVRFFLNTASIIALIISYAQFSNFLFKVKINEIKIDVSDKREIRFLNYILDLLVVAHLSFWPSKYEYFQNWEFPFLFALISFAYYFILEVLFRQTLGKVVTETYVISSKYSFAYAIFLRTLCRRIPFEPLSFFGKGIWHDTLSKTKVVRIDMIHTNKQL